MAERNLNFNQVIERTKTNSLKYDFAIERGKPEQVLPLWVADMDFQVSSYIEDALVQQARHGIYGYSETAADYFNAIGHWMKNHYDWEISQSWLVKTPGIVFALAAAVRAYTKEGDGVLIQTPVYYPFSEVVWDNDRRVLENTLYQDAEGRYQIDFNDFEEKIVTERVKLFFLCNPHNPVGRVWSRKDLVRLGDICLKYGVIVVSDEIHSDYVFHGTHQVFAKLRPEYEAIAVTCTSPGKTFNIAGLQNSNILIPSEELRNRFKKSVAATGYSQLNGPGIVACEAAYRHGEIWYQEVKKYIYENIKFVKSYIDSYLPEIRMQEPEGTYLLWLDFRELGLTEEALEDLIVNGAGLWLDKGSMFGTTGIGFERLNAACPRERLEEALEKLKTAVKELKKVA